MNPVEKKKKKEKISSAKKQKTCELANITKNLN
jgi:hypothetical protein